ncbi:MAG: hypothetical protein Q4B70_19100, partial [Lachnospiraceae bacterium]|nr:hypothetical protein [Lachnospiraceae bacterium]
YNYVERLGSLTKDIIDENKLKDFITSNKMRNLIIDKRLLKQSRRRQYFNYFCILLDTYCKVEKKNDDSNNVKKMLINELRRIRSKAIEGIKAEERTRIKDKAILLLGACTPEGYRLLLKMKNVTKLIERLKLKMESI